MRRLRVACLLVAAACACKRAPKPTPVTEQALEPPLKAAVLSAKGLPPCDRTIPQEWGVGWPVPAATKSGKDFKVFFYPHASIPNADWVGAPLGEAVIDLRTGAVSACRRAPGSVRILGDRLSDEQNRMTVDEYRRRQNELYERAVKIAVLYSKKLPPTPDQVREIAEYEKLFDSMAEPALVPYYNRLNADFWDWLRQNGAPAPRS